MKAEYPDRTELEVLYEDFGGLELPKTGGAGTTSYMVTGCSLALLAGLALLRRKRYR